MPRLSEKRTSIANCCLSSFSVSGRWSPVILLSGLPLNIGYAVAVNDYSHAESIDLLADTSDYFCTRLDSLGYDLAVNHLVNKLKFIFSYIGIFHTDLGCYLGTLEKLIAWLQIHPEASFAGPQICDESGNHHKLCKNNPTVLTLLSHRLLPE